MLRRDGASGPGGRQGAPQAGAAEGALQMDSLQPRDLDMARAAARRVHG
jgi:hypothetical protein